MPLSKDEFLRLHRAGLSVEDIVAKERGGADTSAVAVPPPIAAGAPAESGNPLAGIAGAATEAVSGLKGYGLAAGGGALPFLVARMMRGRGVGRPAPVPAAGPPPGPPPEGTPVPFLEPPDKNFVTLTPEDVQHPEFSRFKPGFQMSRKLYEDTLTGRAKPAAPGRSVKRAMARAQEPVRPITMEGQPANAPAAEPPNGPGVGRGKSGPKLAREAAYRSARQAGAPAERAMGAQPEGRGKVLPFLQEGVAPGEVDPIAAQRAMARLPLASRVAAREALGTVMSAEASAAEKAAATAALRSVLGRVGGGALMALPFLIDLARGTNPIDEAAPLLKQMNREAGGPGSRRPPWMGKEPAYGEPGYRGPI